MKSINRLLIDDIEHLVPVYRLQQRFFIEVIVIFENSNEFFSFDRRDVYYDIDISGHSRHSIYRRRDGTGDHVIDPGCR